MALIRLNINGKEVTVQEGQTILDAAKSINIEIPTMCHDERVKSYGSCGICVVEAEGMPRLLRACSTLAADGMIIKTESKKITATRKTALELLLSDHKGDCRPPCVLACPGQVDCQGYVGLIANGEYKQAIELTKERLPLPASIGRACPHPCEEACRRKLVEQPISIAQLKYFMADTDLHSEDVFKPDIGEFTGKRAAVIGGGPGGLTAAYFLRRYGHAVTIYDSMPEMGGMLRYGIPEYRLPKSILAEEVALIRDMGIKMVNNVSVDKDITLDNLRNKYDAVIVAIGAWSSSKLRCPGEDLEGVTGGIDFLRSVHFTNVDLTGKKVAVVGGSNTAMDACRTAVRLGADTVYNIYRRTRNEMPAEEIEISEAEEEGVIFKNLTNPNEIIGDNGKAKQIRLQIMELGEPDASGRRSPIAVEGKEEILDIDLVIIAIGQTNNNTGFESLTLTKRNTIASDEDTFRTNLEGVFAIGDAINKGSDIAIAAIGEARKAADIINKYFNGENVKYKEPYLVKQDIASSDLKDKAKINRVEMRCRNAEERKHDFNEINYGYSEAEATAEAKRCLECGCHDYFECKLIDYANRYDAFPAKFEGAINSKPVKDEHPFIIRNMNKCILCGLCVRICDEVMGICALGLANRGFQAQVMPSMDTPLADSGCVSCGQCIAICPTGALGEKYEPSGHKQVPLKDKQTESVCSQCSVGCKSILSTKGNMHLRCLPSAGELLCEKGRFGFINDEKNDRILSPMIRKDGELTKATFEEAYKYINERLSKYKDNSSQIAVSVSDSYTNEEIAMSKKFAEKYLKTQNIVCSGYIKSGLDNDWSTSNYGELLSTGTIILIADSILNSHTILGMKIKQAYENGVKVIHIHKSSESNSFEYADIDIDIASDDYLQTLTQIENGSDEDSKITEAAKLYKTAKKAIIVYVQNDLTIDEMKAVNTLSKNSGHYENARNGIIQMKPNANTQGLCNLGINKNFNDLKCDEIKALINFGDNIPFENIGDMKFEFLCVQSAYYSESTNIADVVLPGVSLIEKTGTYTASDGSVQKLTAAMPVKTGVSVIEMIDGLIDLF